MTKQNIVDILSDIFIPQGFKKKGNYWVANGKEINKMVDLQKSQYSNSFYINYGFIINAIPLTGLKTHIFGRLGSMNKSEQIRINQLMDLENEISDVSRAVELDHFIRDKVMRRLNSVNNEPELLEYIYKLPTLNMVPGVVKNYFNIE